MPVLLAIAVGGALGSLARWALEEALVWAGPDSGSWPWATLTVNVLGALAIGVLMSSRILEGRPAWWRPMLVTGVLGGFTTFSAFSLDFAYLVERKQVAAAGGYALASVVISLLAVFAGMNLIRTLYAA